MNVLNTVIFSSNGQRVLESIVTSAITLTQAKAALLALPDSLSEELVVKVSFGLSQVYSGLRLKPGEGLAGKVWQRGQTILLENYQQDEKNRELADHPELKSGPALGLPLLSPQSGKVLGVLLLFLPQGGSKFDPADLKALEDFTLLASFGLEASQFKSECMGKISREVRTPLTGILGMSELLLETSLTSEQKEYAQNIYNSALSMRDLVNSSLESARPDQVVFKLVNARFSLAKAVDEVATLVTPQAHRRNLTFRYAVDPRLPPWYIGDEKRIQQVLLRLLDTTLRINEKGEVALRVWLKSRHENEAQVYFEVSYRALLPVVVTQDQLDLSRTVYSENISFSKQTVTLMGGQFGEESREQEYATFWFILPLKLVEHTRPLARFMSPHNLRENGLAQGLFRPI